MQRLVSLALLMGVLLVSMSADAFILLMPTGAAVGPTCPQGNIIAGAATTSGIVIAGAVTNGIIIACH
jgi:hypothetical protein